MRVWTALKLLLQPSVVARRFIFGVAFGLILIPFSSFAGSNISLGANVNKNICELSRERLDSSHTIWVRGFIPALEFIDGPRRVGTDKQLQLIKAITASGRKVILSIKWNLKRRGVRVPPPGSSLEANWFSFAGSLAAEMGRHIEILSLVNEMYDDTLETDLHPRPNGKIPFIEFQERLIAHVQTKRPVNSSGKPLPLYTGGLTGVHTPRRQNLPGMLSMLQLVNDNAAIAGLDFHMHTTNFSEMEAALRYVRRKVVNKPIIVTEFSNVWGYKLHVKEALGVNKSGREFAAKYRLDPKLRVAEYIRAAQKRKKPEREWQDFIASRDWLDPDYLTKAADIMARYNVTIATYSFAFPGFSDVGNEVDEQKSLSSIDTTPWVLNPVFINNVAVGEGKQTPVNSKLFADYRRLQEPAKGDCERQKNCPWQRPPAAKQAGSGECVF